MRRDWITNDTESARKLNRADIEYVKARSKSMGLALADKVIAFRLAKEVRDNTYQSILKGE